MGWGLVTVQRYEQGSLQDAAHDVLLRKLVDPGFVLEMLGRSGNRLSQRERDLVREAALNRLESVSEEAILAGLLRLIERKTRGNPSLVGWQDFSIDRLAHVIAWFSENVKGLLKTKLAKLLWLADFGHFAQERRAITGLAYARGPYGPVPDSYQALLGVLEELGYIKLEPIRLAHGEGEVVKSLVDFDPSLLSVSEITCLEQVKRRFGQLSGQVLSELSHREQAWVSRKDGEMIPFQEADASRLVGSLL